MEVSVDDTIMRREAGCSDRDANDDGLCFGIVASCVDRRFGTSPITLDVRNQCRDKPRHNGPQEKPLPSTSAIGSTRRMITSKPVHWHSVNTVMSQVE